MINEINPIQLAILADWSKERAIYLFHKIDGMDHPHTLPKVKKSDLVKWQKKVSVLEKESKLPLTALISDVQKNFTANKHCMEYVYKKLAAKVKPNDDNGFYPLKISIPSEVSFLISDEQREKIINEAPNYLPVDVRRNIEKHKIQIV